MSRGIKLLGGSSNPALHERISRLLGVELAEVDLGKFSNGETQVRCVRNVCFCFVFVLSLTLGPPALCVCSQVMIHESTRECDVFILQTTSNPNPNDNLMELMIMIDAVKRASASRITAGPFFWRFCFC
jgi:ribose-phosphate pyrophosphokinase